MGEVLTPSEGLAVPPLPTLRLRRRRWLVVVGAVAVVACVAFALFAYSTEHTFSLEGGSVGDLERPTCDILRFPAGATVYFHWSAHATTTLGVETCSDSSQMGFSGQTVYSGSGTSGSGSFTANGGLYWFGHGCPVECGPPAYVNGTYWGPLV